MNPSLPILALATGDPLSIGPEIMVKALADPRVAGMARFLVLGPAACLRQQARALGAALEFQAVADPQEARYVPGVVDVLEEGQPDFSAMAPGRVVRAAGEASVAYVIRAARLALQGQAAAVVTGPINKESVQLAGYTEYIGNTEILEDICARHTGKKFAGKCLTMLISKQLRVAHVLRHVAFKDIVPRLTPEKLEQTIRLTVLGMMSLGFPQPRVAVAGLNPHNGDGGLMGDEEARLLTPMVDQLKGEGLNLTGPVPADSVFFRAIHGEFDAVVALYHDQGHIAVKTHGFEESISVSFGLPVIRTSVDHGTAFDLAGKGVASPTSLVESIKMACHIVKTGQWQVAP